MKIALEEIPPLSMRTISSAFAALTLLGICAVSRRRLRIASAKSWGHVCVISLLNIGFFSILSAYAQIAAATTRVTILAYTMPMWAVSLAWVVLRERPNASQTLAVGLCAVGLAVLIYPLAKGGVPLGLLLALAAGAMWGAGTVYVKWAPLELDPFGATFWQLAIAFGGIAGCLIVVDGRLNLDHAHAGSILAAAFTGIFGSGVAYATWLEIVRRLPASTASLGALGIPVVGVVSTVLITGEKLSIADMSASR
jgi:drug/metabolite transporter (DMT)-like permease